MAFLINNTPVIDNSRNLANIASFDSTVASTWDQVTTTGISKTLVNREYCTVTIGFLTITLPASPSAGWEVLITVGNFSNTIIGRNGQNIMSLAENMTIDSSYASVRLTYVDATRGWVIT